MKYKLEWTYKLKGNKKVLFSSEWIDSELALATGDELEKSGKTADLLFYDEMGTSWTPKELRKLTEEIDEEPHDLFIYFDGGFDKETKKSGLGAVIYFKQGKKKFRLRANQVFDELNNNNEAEYAALYYALTLLEELEVRQMPCELIGDSQVVLKQLEGEWPCYEEELNRWLDRIEEKIKKIGLRPSYKTVGRKENKEADKLATQALEGKMINSKMQII
ncbi:reverse transcriptase-like protein [Mesobacillus harenae]|uniref:reverse transcriptase-like protein n=1 Tax=Mesobacillus harenae TaxID=2213203 RepID=UPI001580B6F6|nr:reverse transcriptase-like protein [Mesobacillus harenae]